MSEIESKVKAIIVDKLGVDETDYVKYKILLYFVKDDDNNIFSYEIKKSSTNILVGDCAFLRF